MGRSVRFRFLTAALALGAASVRADPPGALREAAAPQGAAPVERVATPDLHVRPPVAGLSDLREYGAADRVVGDRVDRLRMRRNVAVAAFGGAVLSGVVGYVVTMSRAVDRVGEPCPTAGGGECRVEPDYGPALVSAGVSLALVLAGVAVLPKRSDVADTVALWNGRHPEAQLAMDEEPRAVTPARSGPE